MKPEAKKDPNASGQCLRGCAHHVEIGVPARSAWHDHSTASRIAIEESREWANTGERLVPPRGFPDVVRTRNGLKRRPPEGRLF
jgi:hypothetical protein